MYHLTTINVKLYIAFAVCLFDRRYLDVLTVIFILIFMFDLFVHQCRDKKLITTKQILICFVMIVIGLLTIWLFSRYSIRNTVLSFVFLIICYICFNNHYMFVEQSSEFDWFYIIVTFGFMYLLAKAFIDNTIYSANFTLPGSWDKNYTGAIIFLYFCYCKKNRYLIGIILSFIYTYYLNSRLLILTLILLYVIEAAQLFLDRKQLFQNIRFKLANIKGTGIFCIFTALTVFLIIFSYFWTFYISNAYVTGYQQSFNDKSNAIRMRSNIYAVELMLDDANMLIYGYDDDIRKELGVEDRLNVTNFMGYRLVQPHNFVLNLCMKHGVFLAVVYLALLSSILAYWWQNHNLKYILAYIFMNMFMHSLLSTTYLLFFIFILAAPQKERVKRFEFV